MIQKKKREKFPEQGNTFLIVNCRNTWIWIRIQIDSK